jgi:peroxiredoxin
VAGWFVHQKKLLQMKNLWIIFIIGSLWPLATVAQPRKGDKAPELRLPDAQGKNIAISSFKGSVVLLDFWASWCGPCRENSPELVKLYATFKGQGFQILGVSVDDNRSVWQRAVKADKMTWPQVIVPASAKNMVLSTYGVSYIPATFLVDRDGVLQEADLHGVALEQAVRRLLQ